MFPAVACLLLALTALQAEDARQIVEESQRRGHTDSARYVGRLQVIAVNKHIAEKSWDFERLGSYGNSSATTRFTSPAEVKGVALLIVNHPDRSADQWIWTPALGRDRRIALQDRSTRFFGTDFSFEDLEERDVGQFDFNLLGGEDIDGARCWHIQSTPKQTKSSQYTSSQIWFSKDHYLALRFDNFVNDKVVRRLLEQNVQNVQGVWTALSLDMADLRRNRPYRPEDRRFALPMRAENFTVQALRRRRRKSAIALCPRCDPQWR
jgi:hypothetical protein